MKQIRTVGVVGAGQMGAGIAQLFALKGYEVLLCDAEESRCLGAVKVIGASLDRLMVKGKLSQEQVAGAMRALHPVMNLGDLHGVDLVVEAVTEDVELKKKLFQQLDNLTSAEVILASNTSSIPISTLAGATGRPQKVLGVHFMNPPQVIEGVEMIRGKDTSDETVQTMERVLLSLGKKIVRAGDSAGFTVNRILFPMINEAIHVLEEGLLSAAEIDESMKICCHQPMGPLALADMIGLDTVHHILNIMEMRHGERYRAAAPLSKMLEAGRLGKKAGAGFYDYASDKNRRLS